MAMSKEKQQAITETRRTQILDAALELFDLHGYSNTAISDIANKIGISKGLIYHYFSSKEDILFALSERLSQCLEECHDYEDPLEGIRLFAARLLSYPYYQGYVPPLRVFFTAVLRDEVKIDQTKSPITEDFGSRYFGDLFRRGQALGEFRDGDPEEFGEILWKYMVGRLATMSPAKEGMVYQPNIDSVLDLFLAH